MGPDLLRFARYGEVITAFVYGVQKGVSTAFGMARPGRARIVLNRFWIADGDSPSRGKIVEQAVSGAGIRASGGRGRIVGPDATARGSGRRRVLFLRSKKSV